MSAAECYPNLASLAGARRSSNPAINEQCRDVLAEVDRLQTALQLIRDDFRRQRVDLLAENARLRAALQRIRDDSHRQHAEYEPDQRGATDLGKSWHDGYMTATSHYSLVAFEALDPVAYAEQGVRAPRAAPDADAMTTTRLLLDMDGPLTDFDAHFWQVCNDAGWAFDIDDPRDQRHRFFDGHIIDPSHRKLARQMIDGTPWFRDLPVTPGATDGVPKLMERYDVWVCTKPLEANQWCASDKAAWIARHFPQLVGRLIMAPDKSMIVGDVLLDDAPHPGWYEHAMWRPVIFRAPFNGAGSKWGDLPSWGWDDPIDLLDATPDRRLEPPPEPIDRLVAVGLPDDPRPVVHP